MKIIWPSIGLAVLSESILLILSEMFFKSGPDGPVNEFSRLWMIVHTPALQAVAHLVHFFGGQDVPGNVVFGSMICINIVLLCAVFFVIICVVRKFRLGAS